MAIDDGDGGWICNRDMIWLYAHQRAKLFVGFINGQIAPSSPALIEQPEIAEYCELRTWDVSYGIISYKR